MSRWQIKSTALDEREKDYTGTFVCTNVDTGKRVTLALTQSKGDPADDLIGACRALAQLLLSVASDDEPESNSNTGRLQ